MARARSVADEFVVAIDLGTSACKVAAFDRLGAKIAYGRSPYTNLTDATGRVEQNPSVWWSALKHAVRESGVTRYRKQIIGYAVSSLRAAVLPVDSHGKTLGNAILAPDRRAHTEVKLLSERFDEGYLYQTTGLRLSTYASLCRILWLKKRSPDVFLRTAKIFGAQDYLIYRLCGRIVTDRSQASRSLCFNIRTGSWDAKIIRASGLSRDLFPDVIEPGGVVGDLTASAARALDLPQAPVIVSGGDQMCASVGLGAVAPGHVTINHGTGSFLEAPAENIALDPHRQSLCSVHILPHLWIQECPMLTTGRRIEETARIFGRAHSSFLGLIEESLSKRRHSSRDHPLLFLPCGGDASGPHWKADLPGVLWGLKDHHGACDVLHSIFQAIAFDVRRSIQILGSHPSEIALGGKLSCWDKFNQMQADILGIPLARTEEPEATALGAAAIAYSTLGFYPSTAAAIQTMVRRAKGPGWQPRPREHARYEGIFSVQSELLRLAANFGKAGT